MGPFGIGQSISRFEDARLLRGEGRFIHDVHAADEAYLVLVRSPHAHARIRSIDLVQARAAAGVVGVLTGEDLIADGLGTPEVTFPRKRPDGSPVFWRPHTGLTTGHVRYVGDPVVAVVADSLQRAKDAAELVAIDYEDLPSVTDTLAAAGAAPVWENARTTCRMCSRFGDAAATEAAFSRARAVVNGRYLISRVHAQFMEPRGALGEYDAQRALHAAPRHPVPAPRTRPACEPDPESPAREDPRGCGRRRRRIRREGLDQPRASARALAGEEARPAGEMDMRAQRSAARRRARARLRQRSRACARCERQVPRRSGCAPSTISEVRSSDRPA
jgi:hypothetical protein